MRNLLRQSPRGVETTLEDDDEETVQMSSPGGSNISITNAFSPRDPTIIQTDIGDQICRLLPTLFSNLFVPSSNESFILDKIAYFNRKYDLHDEFETPFMECGEMCLLNWNWWKQPNARDRLNFEQFSSPSVHATICFPYPAPPTIPSLRIAPTIVYDHEEKDEKEEKIGPLGTVASGTHGFSPFRPKRSTPGETEIMDVDQPISMDTRAMDIDVKDEAEEDGSRIPTEFPLPTIMSVTHECIRLQIPFGHIVLSSPDAQIERIRLSDYYREAMVPVNRKESTVQMHEPYFRSSMDGPTPSQLHTHPTQFCAHVSTCGILLPSECIESSPDENTFSLKLMIRLPEANRYPDSTPSHCLLIPLDDTIEDTIWKDIGPEEIFLFPGPGDELQIHRDRETGRFEGKFLLIFMTPDYGDFAPFKIPAMLVHYAGVSGDSIETDVDIAMDYLWKQMKKMYTEMEEMEEFKLMRNEDDTLEHSNYGMHPYIGNPPYHDQVGYGSDGADNSDGNAAVCGDEDMPHGMS